MGFFMGMSGLVGSVMCSAVINPFNKEWVNNVFQHLYNTWSLKEASDGFGI